MTISHTSLTFSTTNQSLWGPGGAFNFRIDTGDALIFDPAEATYDFDIGALGFGIQGQAYIDFKVGLLAYLNLPSAGAFDASFSLSVNVALPGAIDTTVTDDITLDFSDWSYGSAEISSVGFNGSPSAGLDLILGINAGIRDMSYYTWFNEGVLPDFSLVNYDGSIPLLSLSANTELFEIQLFTGLTLTGELPTGADTEGTSSGSGVVSASGISDTNFISLNADIDELLVYFLSKIPGAGAVAKFLGETVFAEFEFDVHDYVPFIPANKFVLSATILDIGASAGAAVTEDVSLDIGGQDDVPDIFITLRSDNGTPDNTSDDYTTSSSGVASTGMLGNSINIAAPTGNGGTGTAKITAMYDLRNAVFTHAVGIGINASFTIEALQASLGGAWVPSALAFTFGPLLSLEFPEGGFSAGLFDFYNDSFKLANSAFAPQSSTYEVFYTNAPPVGWDPDAAGAQQAVLDYRQALVDNLAAGISAFGQLWDNSPTQDVQNFASGHVTFPVPTFNTTRVWQSNVNASFFITGIDTNNNYIIVDPGTAPLSNLKVNVSSQLLSAAYMLPASLGYNASASDIKAMMDLLVFNPSTRLYYEYGSGANLRTLGVSTSVEVVGKALGDILVHYKDGAQYFDGGDHGSQHDLFVANFAVTDGFTPISWDLFSAVNSGAAVDLGNGVNVKNVEAMWLLTGRGNDDIVTYLYSDYVSTSDGDDYIRNAGDYAVDTILAGADDDQIVTWVAAQPTPAASAYTDRISGGTGKDIALHDNGAGQALRVGVLFEAQVVFQNQGFANGIGSDASLLNLYTLAVVYVDGILEDPIPQLDRDNSDNSIIYINNSYQQGATSYSSDIEGISVIGSDVHDDLVLFTGGLVNKGGGIGNANSNADALVADFHSFQSLVNATNGVRLIAGVGAATFGDAFFSGFERFVVFGSTYDDLIEGGNFGDVITGEEGNDVLYGGNDSTRDFLGGGSGNDFIKWANDGADVIWGDEGFFSDGLPGDIDTLVITADENVTSGLLYDFHTEADFNTLMSGGAGVDVHSDTYYYAYDSAALLLNALSLARNADANSQMRAVSFGNVNNTGFMVYSGIEKTNVIGSSAFDDLLIYESGATYEGGESANDADTFAADFSDQKIGVSFRIVDEDTTGQFLENGVFHKGIDRAVIRGGEGNDFLIGGWLNDYFEGGIGSDQLYGGGGNDELHGGVGGDTVYWFSDGNDVASGGEGQDMLFRSGSVCLNSRCGVLKWTSASVMPPPSRWAAG